MAGFNHKGTAPGHEVGRGGVGAGMRRQREAGAGAGGARGARRGPGWPVRIPLRKVGCSQAPPMPACEAAFLLRSVNGETSICASGLGVVVVDQGRDGGALRRQNCTTQACAPSRAMWPGTLFACRGVTRRRSRLVKSAWMHEETV